VWIQVRNILLYGELKEPLHGPPDSFLDRDFPELLELLFAKTRLSDPLPFARFLVSVGALYPWSAWHRPAMFRAISRLWDTDHPLYRSDPRFRTMLLDAAKQDMWLSIIQVRCRDKADLAHFQYFFRLHAVYVVDCRPSIPEGAFREVFTNFGKEVQTNKFAKSDPASVANAVRMSIPYAIEQFRDPTTFTKAYEAILQLGSTYFFGAEDTPRF
jgi:hypothetical protein